MWEKKISVQPPYDFDQAINRLAIDPLNKVSLSDKTVDIPIYKDDTVIKVQSLGTKDKPVFLLSGKNVERKEHHIQVVEDIFQWNVSLQTVYNHFHTTNLKDLFTEHYGTPLIREFSVYSCLMKCIIHQQLNLKFAHTLTERFVQNFGYQLEGVWFYPSPEKVSQLSYQSLRDLQFSQRKAEYVIDTSRLIVEKKLQLERLFELTDEEIISELVKVRGIGPWTAQNVLLFGLGRQNLLPKADIGIQNALKKYFKFDKKPTKEQIDELSEMWHPYASYASLYLWRSIEP